MVSRAWQLAIFLLLLSRGALGQVLITPPSRHEAIAGSLASSGLTSPGQASFDLWTIGNAPQSRSPLQGPSGSVSRLDLKAPEKARREYAKGYEKLTRKDLRGAVEHLTSAISVYPQFVGAHNALGSAYLRMGQNDLAREQFAQAILLDDHLPGSYLNLGSAQLALKDYRSAEESVGKASSLAPLDLQLATVLTYTQLMNQDYGAVLATAHRVHSRKHEGAAMVHYFAAAACQERNNLRGTEEELETFLREDPTSPAAEQARLVLRQIKANPVLPAAAGEEANAKAAATPGAGSSPVSSVRVGPRFEEQVAERLHRAGREAKGQSQIADGEPAPGESMCSTCSAPALGGPGEAGERGSHPSPGNAPGATSAPFAVRRVVDEVAVFFAATDHGKSVTDLTREEIGILDDRKPPASITGFRNERELPLRLGIVIDTSESVTARFSFEQRAAVHFLQKVLGGSQDLAFVVGVANSVLLVQDFTGDQERMSHAIDQLAPAGGTALWDAVSFAAHKLAGRPETQPVARALVVISDGNDNSSRATLQEAIASAEHGEVFVYTVSAPAAGNGVQQSSFGDPAVVGVHAMKVLADRTGGAAFVPNSLRGLDHGLDEVQQVLRSRYLISYRPALLKDDGQYRAIDISARKSGHKLRVYARRGYYARVDSGEEDF
jgi:Ca-activated chloride channel family protein